MTMKQLAATAGAAFALAAPSASQATEAETLPFYRIQVQTADMEATLAVTPSGYVIATDDEETIVSSCPDFIGSELAVTDHILAATDTLLTTAEQASPENKEIIVEDLFNIASGIRHVHEACLTSKQPPSQKTAEEMENFLKEIDNRLAPHTGRRLFTPSIN